MYRYTDPLTALENMLTQLENKYDRKLNAYKVPSDPEAWIPPAEVWETEKTVNISLDVPGIVPSEIDVQAEGDNLIIRGERKFVADDDKKYQRKEKVYGRFYRSFEIPSQVERENISASYKNGVLVITLPKSSEVKPKQVKINVED